MDLLPGMTIPTNGRRVYHENWSFEQEAKARAMAARILDILSSGIQTGGDVTVAGVSTITIGPTLAYDDSGHRILIPENTDFILPSSGEFTIAIRHRFDSSPGNVADMQGTIVEHRSDAFEVVAIDGPLEIDDVPLRIVTNSGGTIVLGSDIRKKRNLSISGDTILSGGLTIAGNLSKILNEPNWTETNEAPSAYATKALIETLISTAVNNFLDGAPDALNTLNELAAAINDDASFASAVNTALANRYTKSESDTRYPLRSNNLSDLSNITSARSNLSVYSKAETNSLISGAMTGIKAIGSQNADGTQRSGGKAFDNYQTGAYRITKSLLGFSPIGGIATSFFVTSSRYPSYTSMDMDSTYVYFYIFNSGGSWVNSRFSWILW